MGRRKIDIAYLNDDRVRKVTFCKRKGGLFKKADDLSKLCGVEVAVVIVGDKKACDYASTDMNRILERYRDLQSGGNGEDVSENCRLWEQLELQRRELEAMTRELASEKRKVEELRGSQQAETNQPMLLPSTLPPPIIQPVLTGAPVTSPQEEAQQPLVISAVSVQPQLCLASILKMAPPVQQVVIAQDAHEEMSDDTAEVDSASEATGSEGTCTEERSSKRIRLNDHQNPVKSFTCGLDQLGVCALDKLNVVDMCPNPVETNTSSQGALDISIQDSPVALLVAPLMMAV